MREAMLFRAQLFANRHSWEMKSEFKRITPNYAKQPTKRISSYARFQCYVHRRHLRSSFDMLLKPFNCQTGNFSDY